MDATLNKSAYMKMWRERKELENPGYLDQEREKARLRQAKRLARLSQDPEWVEKERQRKAEAMRIKRADPETRATLNSRKRELAQQPEAKLKQAIRLKDWKSKNSESVAAYQKQWREENFEHLSNYSKAYMAEYTQKPKVQADIFKRNLWKNYRMTTHEFNELWGLQDGKCAICSVVLLPRGRQNDSAVVDHNHDTGAVRGLLCRSCNVGVGLLKDNTEILKSAAKYLTKSGTYGKHLE
jgi:hypothetical protein